jgi:hypothetical protein
MIDRLMPLANNQNLPDGALQMQMNMKPTPSAAIAHGSCHDHHGRTRKD